MAYFEVSFRIFERLILRNGGDGMRDMGRKVKVRKNDSISTPKFKF